MIPIGSTVELLDYEDNSTISYRLIEPSYGVRYVGAGFVNGERTIYTRRELVEGGDGLETISTESPLGERIRNGKAGDIIEYNGPSGYPVKFKILKVTEPESAKKDVVKEEPKPIPKIEPKPVQKATFEPVIKEIPGLKQRNGVYYIHDYIRQADFSLYPEEKTQISKRIWNYKDGDPDALKEFTKDLDDAIYQISLNAKGRQFALVAVPPSKKDKYSPVRESIKLIVLHNSRGTDTMHRSKVLLDYGKLLLRDYDIPAMHEYLVFSEKPSDEVRKNSIKCTQKDLSKVNANFIIMDDVTTTGRSMEICEEILMEHGVRQKNIYKLAVSGTIR